MAGSFHFWFHKFKQTNFQIRSHRLTSLIILFGSIDWSLFSVFITLSKSDSVQLIDFLRITWFNLTLQSRDFNLNISRNSSCVSLSIYVSKYRFFNAPCFVKRFPCMSYLSIVWLGSWGNSLDFIFHIPLWEKLLCF